MVRRVETNCRNTRRHTDSTFEPERTIGCGGNIASLCMLVKYAFGIPSIAVLALLKTPHRHDWAFSTGTLLVSSSIALLKLTDAAHQLAVETYWTSISIARHDVFKLVMSTSSSFQLPFELSVEPHVRY